MRDLPPIEWRAVLIGGAVAALAAVLLSIASQEGASALGMCVGAAVAGRLATVAGPYHGGLVAVLFVVAEALADPFRPAPASVPGDLAATTLLDVVRIALGVAFGWLGYRLRR